MFIDSSDSKNILIVGESGSGKSFLLINTVLNLVKTDKRIFIFSPTAPLPLNRQQSIENSLLDIDSPNLTRETDWVDAWNDGCELPKSLLQDCYDIVIIDELEMLNKKGKDKLFWLMMDRPGIKFIVSTQIFYQQYKEAKKHFDKVLFGKSRLSSLDEMAQALDIDTKIIKQFTNGICRYQFVKMDLKSKLLAN